jgi:hypothetical protein
MNEETIRLHYININILHDKTDPNEISEEDWEEAKHFDFPGFVCSLVYVTAR